MIIVTWRRPDHVARCLQALSLGLCRPDEVVVVDASEDDRTKAVVEGTEAVHVRFPGGAGHMTTARNEGLQHVSGSIISFLDDDVRPTAGWAAAVQNRFRSEPPAAVAGRVVNGQPGEETDGLHAIGTLSATGELTGNFAADPGRVVEVAHGIGANMTFHRDWLARIGGFRDVFPGTATREDTDVFLRIGSLGGRMVFDPAALVVNDSGPHVVGRRFDLRYAAFLDHNHLLLLVLNFGLRPGSPVWRYLAVRYPALPRSEPQRRWESRVVRSLACGVALLTGLLHGALLSRTARGATVRTDRIGVAVSRHLSMPSRPRVQVPARRPVSDRT